MLFKTFLVRGTLSTNVTNHSSSLRGVLNNMMNIVLLYQGGFYLPNSSRYKTKLNSTPTQLNSSQLKFNSTQLVLTQQLNSTLSEPEGTKDLNSTYQCGRMSVMFELVLSKKSTVREGLVADDTLVDVGCCGLGHCSFC